MILYFRKPDDDAAFSTLLATFFVNKVRNIKSLITAKIANCVPVPLLWDVPFQHDVMSTFSPVTASEVHRVLKTMSCKSSPLDFVPTSLLKACSGAFSYIIANLANLSFEHGTFPSAFKTAQKTPLLKQPGLDSSEPSNYRPICSLNTISKVIERLALTRIILHIASHHQLLTHCSQLIDGIAHVRRLYSELQTTSLRRSILGSQCCLLPSTSLQHLTA